MWFKTHRKRTIKKVEKGNRMCYILNACFEVHTRHTPDSHLLWSIEIICCTFYSLFMYFWIGNWIRLFFCMYIRSNKQNHWHIRDFSVYINGNFVERSTDRHKKTRELGLSNSQWCWRCSSGACFICIGFETIL